MDKNLSIIYVIKKGEELFPHPFVMDKYGQMGFKKWLQTA